MLRAILNKSWRQHPTRHQLYGQLPPITKAIQVRRTRHAGHCWRSRDELISDVLLWTPTHGRAKAGRPARTYIQQLCENTGCCPEELSEAMNDREKWRERVRDIHATSTTWWWWWWFLFIKNGFCLFTVSWFIFFISVHISLRKPNTGLEYKCCIAINISIKTVIQTHFQMQNIVQNTGGTQKHRRDSKNACGSQKHRQDSKTQAGLKNACGSQKHRRDSKTHAGLKNTGGSQKHRQD